MEPPSPASSPLHNVTPYHLHPTTNYATPRSSLTWPELRDHSDTQCSKISAISAIIKEGGKEDKNTRRDRRQETEDRELNIPQKIT